MKLPQDSVPLLHAGAALILGDAVKDFPQPGDAVWRQVDSEVGRVHDPAMEKLDLVPTTVPFAQLLKRRRLMVERGITVAELTEDMINGVEKGLADALKLWVLC